jgi:two-component system invasion response regulator UvrY
MTRPSRSTRPDDGPLRLAKSVRVLLVSGHTILRAGLRLLLDSDPRVRVGAEAADGAGLLVQIPQRTWEVLVTDLMVPDWDSLELLRQVRRSDRRPVLVTSALAGDYFSIRTLRAGADGYVGKDSTPADLIEAILRVHGGQKFVTPERAAGLAGRFADGDRGFMHEGLSDREFQVLCRLGSGNSIKEIGRLLSVSPKTVSTYRSRLLAKMGLENDAALIRYVTEHRLVF